MSQEVPATVSEAAREAKCSEDTIRRRVDAGLLLAMRTSSGLRLIDRAALDEYVRERAALRQKSY